MTEYAATYISANQFSVEDDQTSHFHVTEMVRVEAGGNNLYSSISATSFGAGITTITLTQSILTDPCDFAEPSGIWSGATGNVPPHLHEDDNTGGTGVKGAPPQHEVSGSQIRFKQSDGSWGEWMDLQGDPGVDGATWYSGDGAPSVGLGDDGDFYLDIGVAS